MKSVHGWNGKQVPAEVFFEASHAVQTKLGCQLTPDDIKERMQFFELRYRTFKAMVATYRVTWEVKDHFIQADEAVWKKIFKHHPFAAAYFHCDELDFSRLAIVFGMEDVKVEEVTNVIVISDSTEILPLLFVPTITTPTDPDEVNSPLITVIGSVRRKLFDEEGDSRDRESNNGHLPPYYSHPTSVKLDSKLGNPKLGNLVKQLTPPACSPNAYSSASWSPFGGYRKH
ncbi:hypothetical protein SASPL_101003 [Salvia splendens]|uniref:Myb/SANT-like domain-containing protein n=1 Tax=Salvia splendens TaxID=180675 RepID=A0A8X8YR41_SALSN|nr:hypothetical protein SASPL_101003 [Salvia splendens]